MDYEVREVVTEGTPTAVIKMAVGPDRYATAVPAACGRVWESHRSEPFVNAGRHMAVYAANVLKEVGVEVGATFEPRGDVVPSSLPGGRVATTTHIGPYQDLGKAHEAVQRWCRDHGRSPVKCCWEIYGHERGDGSAPRTDVFYWLGEAE